MHSYDINDNREYRKIFGLDVAATGVKKRRLTVTVPHEGSTAGVQDTHSEYPAAKGKGPRS